MEFSLSSLPTIHHVSQHNHIPAVTSDSFHQPSETSCDAGAFLLSSESASPATSLRSATQREESSAIPDDSGDMSPNPSFRIWAQSDSSIGCGAKSIGCGTNSTGCGASSEREEGRSLRLRRGVETDLTNHQTNRAQKDPRPATWQDWVVRGMCHVILLLLLALQALHWELQGLHGLLAPAAAGARLKTDEGWLRLSTGEFPSAPAAIGAAEAARGVFEPVSQWAIKGACNSREQTMMQHFFREIVLIINTNHKDVAYDTSNFLRSVYGRFFHNIIIMSPFELPDINVEARGHKKWRGSWMFAYFHLPNIFARHPQAEGFLWINDDVAVNYWTLMKANKTKLWLANNLAHGDSRFFPFAQDGKALRSEYEGDWGGSRESRDSAWKSFQSMDESYQKQFVAGMLPLKDMYPKRITNMFYIPKRFVHAFAYDLVPIFREFKVASEIAIPMMFYALDQPQDFDHILDDMMFVWNLKGYDPVRHWSPSIPALHPWQLSSNESKVSFLKALGNVDMCLLRLLDSFENVTVH